MKAKVIKTNKVVEVEFSSVVMGIAYYKSSSGDSFVSNDLIFIDSSNCSGINWEQRRFELVKAISVEVFNYQIESHKRKIEDMIKFVDDLIAKLKEE